MKRPIIGVTMDSHEQPHKGEIKLAYPRAIERAGGVPLLLSFETGIELIPELLEAMDGVMLIGGDDLDPSRYGETRHPKARPLDLRRERFEFALLDAIESRRKPVLGVCLGSQLMNVHRGGDLHQFLPEAPVANRLEHRRVEGKDGEHPVTLVESSALSEAIGRNSIVTNSRHKQAIRKVGRGLRVIAAAPDGVIEGIDDPTMPLFLGVQWHPEDLTDRPEHLEVFRTLVEAARREAQGG